MRLWVKILLVITICLVAFYHISDLAARSLIYNRFDKLEKDLAISDMGRILYFISDSFSNYDDVVRDWATWDDTYAFVKDRNSKFRQANLLPQTFDNLRIHLLMICDEKCRVVFASGYDAGQDALYPLAAKDVEKIMTGFACNLKENKGKQGLVMMPKGVMLVNSRPIIKSDRTGPFRGTLFMGRYLDDLRLNRMISLTHLSVKAYSLNQKPLPVDIKNMLPSLAEMPIRLDNRDQNMMTGYLLMTDVFKNPAIVFRVDNQRTMYFQSQIFSGLLGLNRAVTFFFTGLILLVLLEIVVIRPIDRTNKKLAEIIKKCDIVQEAKAAGGDEMSKLERLVGSMLKELEKRHPQ